MAKLIRCHEDHDYRCEANGHRGEGQCCNLSLAGMIVEGHADPADYSVDVSSVDVCPRHGANKKVEALKNKAYKMYQFGRFKEEATAFIQNDKANSLQEEIVLLRLSLQSILKQCQNDSDILMYTNRITTLTQRIESCVTTMNRLAERSGQFMDKAKAMNIASRMLASITERLPDDQKHLLDDAANEILEMIKAE